MPTAKQVRMRRGTTLDNDLFKGPEGEVTVDTTVRTLRVHDGATLGGFALALDDLSNVATDSEFEQRIMQAVQDLVAASGTGGDSMPQTIGSVTQAFTSPSDTYLKADGSLLKKADYPALYSTIGDRFGADAAAPVSAVSSFPQSGTLVNAVSNDLAVSGQNILMLSTLGMYSLSRDSGKTWVYLNDNSGIVSTRVFYHAGKWVSIGTNKVSTSTDGTTWATASLTGIFTQAFQLNNRLFLFTATGGNYTSTDGLVWTAITTSVFAAAVPLCGYYSSTLGLYFLGGTAAGLMTSPDGLTWTSKTSNMTNAIYAISGNSALVVLAGGNNTTTANIATSTDGTTWTARTNTIAQSRGSVIWFPAANLWVSSGIGGVHATSPDAITWTALTATASGVNSTAPVTGVNTLQITQDGSTLIAMNNGFYATSTNGTTWVSRNFAPYATTSRPYNRMTLMADGTVLLFGPNYLAKTLDNGTSAYAIWAFITAGQVYKAGATNGNGIYIGQFSSILSSANTDSTGTSYLQVYDTSTGVARGAINGVAAVGPANQLAYMGGKFVAWGYCGGLSTSSNGYDWNISYDLPATGLTAKVEYNGTTFVAVGMGSIVYSTDGVTWTAATQSYGAFQLNDVVWDKVTSKFYACGAKPGKALKSSDGITWTEFTVSTIYQLQKVYTSNNYLVFMTSNSTLVSAPFSDLTKWTQAAPPSTTAPAVNKIAGGPDGFVCVGTIVSGGTAYPNIWFSVDGIGWTSIPISFGGTGIGLFNRVIWTGAGYLAIAQIATVATPGTVSVSMLYSSPNGFNWTSKVGFSSGTTLDWLQSILIGGTNILLSGGSTNITTTQVIVQMTLPPSDSFRLPTIIPENSYDPYTYIKVK